MNFILPSSLAPTVLTLVSFEFINSHKLQLLIPSAFLHRLNYSILRAFELKFLRYSQPGLINFDLKLGFSET